PFNHINLSFRIFFFHPTATTEIYTLSYTTLFRSGGPDRTRDLRPAARRTRVVGQRPGPLDPRPVPRALPGVPVRQRRTRTLSDKDRKSTRLNSSHVAISYAVFCLKKKKTIKVI